MISLLLQNETVTKKLARVCKRVGVTMTKLEGQTTLTKIEQREVRVTEPDTKVLFNNNGETVILKEFKVSTAFDRYTLDGFPGVPGYTFVCRIQHTEAGNMIAGPETIEGWKDAKPTCDHCNKLRSRKDTFILRNAETGGLVRIGRNCLADFLRTDPTKLVKVADLHSLISEACEEGFKGGGRWEPDPVHFIACAAVAVELEGFRPSGWDRSTVSQANFLAGLQPKQEPARSDWSNLQPKAHHYTKAEAIVAWLKTADTSSDYMHNLAVAAAQPGVNRRTAGLLASAPQAYAKILGDTLRRSALPESNWIGTKGEKIEREATVIRTMGSSYNDNMLFTLRTDDGCDLAWWCSGKLPSRTHEGEEIILGAGDRVSIRGTVKDLNDYKGRKQTLLTRCKVTFISTPVTN